MLWEEETLVELFHTLARYAILHYNSLFVPDHKDKSVLVVSKYSLTFNPLGKE